MLKSFRQLLSLYFAVLAHSCGFLEKLVPRKFWHSNKKGSTVSISVPDDGERLVLLFQRPIKPSDVKDGKLLSTTWMRITRRGGKRQTGMVLSFQSAETLHRLLGAALQDARAKQCANGLYESVHEVFLMNIAVQNVRISDK